MVFIDISVHILVVILVSIVKWLDMILLNKDFKDSASSPRDGRIPSYFVREANQVVGFLVYCHLYIYYFIIFR